MSMLFYIMCFFIIIDSVFFSLSRHMMIMLGVYLEMLDSLKDQALSFKPPDKMNYIIKQIDNSNNKIADWIAVIGGFTIPICIISWVLSIYVSITLVAGGTIYENSILLFLIAITQAVVLVGLYSCTTMINYSDNNTRYLQNEIKKFIEL